MVASADSIPASTKVLFTQAEPFHFRISPDELVVTVVSDKSSKLKSPFVGSVWSPVLVPEVLAILVFSAAVINPAFVPSAKGKVAFVPSELVTVPSVVDGV